MAGLVSLPCSSSSLRMPPTPIRTTASIGRHQRRRARWYQRCATNAITPPPPPHRQHHRPTRQHLPRPMVPFYQQAQGPVTVDQRAMVLAVWWRWWCDGVGGAPLVPTSAPTLVTPDRRGGAYGSGGHAKRGRRTRERDKARH